MLAPPLVSPQARVTRAAPSRVSLLSRPLLWLFVLLAAVLAAYAPALNAQFLWDDTPLVRNNQLIRSPVIALEAFRHTLFDGDSNFYRPTQTLSYIADYWAWDLNPFGYHLTNILIHGLNAGLLFLLLRGLLPRLVPAAPGRETESARLNACGWMAFGVALLWALHPVHSAAVAYVSGRADTLAMSCLPAGVAGGRAGLRQHPLYGQGALESGCLCLFAARPLRQGDCHRLVRVVFQFAPGRAAGDRAAAETDRRRRRAARAGLLSGACGISPAAPPPPPPAPILPAKGLLMIRALGQYGSLLLFPRKLFMERQVFAAPGLASPASAGFYLALALGGLAFAMALLAGVLWPGRGRLLRRVGAGWFIAGFLPISNLFSLNASVAEHWLYFPSIGFFLFLGGVGLDLPLNPRRVPALGFALVLLAAVALGVRTYLRSFDWQDELTFFRQTIADGGDVPRARDALATAYSHVHDDVRRHHLAAGTGRPLPESPFRAHQSGHGAGPARAAGGGGAHFGEDHADLTANGQRAGHRDHRACPGRIREKSGLAHATARFAHRRPAAFPKLLGTGAARGGRSRAGAGPTGRAGADPRLYHDPLVVCAGASRRRASRSRVGSTRARAGGVAASRPARCA